MSSPNLNASAPAPLQPTTNNNPMTTQSQSQTQTQTQTKGIATGDDAYRPSHMNTIDDNDITDNTIHHPDNYTASQLPDPRSSSHREKEYENGNEQEKEREKAQETFTGAPEVEPVGDLEEKRFGPVGSGVGGVAAAAADDDGGEEEEVGSAGGGGGGKLPFKEQVKAYAKVHRGTLLGNKETKETGQKILAGEMSPVEANSPTSAASHK